MDVDRKDAMFYTQVKNREITVNNVPVESEKLYHPLPADRLPDDPSSALHIPQTASS